MAEKKLDLNPLEVRGLWAHQQAVLGASQQFEQAKAVLEQTEAEAAENLKGRIPEGLSIRNVRIDTQQSAAFVEIPEPTPQA